jgi:hypothetical protein
MITITDEIAQRVAREINQHPWGASCWFDKDGLLLAVDHNAWSFPEGRRWGLFGSAPMPLTVEQVRERLERREVERARWLAWRNGVEE